MEHPVRVTAEPGDERTERCGVELSCPVGIGEVVVEGGAGNPIGVLVVDEDHYPFRHRNAPSK
jgi:hypothetical protein